MLAEFVLMDYTYKMSSSQETIILIECEYLALNPYPGYGHNADFDADECSWIPITYREIVEELRNNNNETDPSDEPG